MTFQTIIEELQNDKAIPLAIPIFLLSMLVEWFIGKKENPEFYQSKDMLVSISMGIFSSIVEFFPKVLAFIAFFYLHEISSLKNSIDRQWWAWILLFFLDDFAYYWFHRMNHEVRLFWAGHVPHHSSVKYNYGTALRQGVGERIHKFIFWLWIPLLGFDALMIFIMMGLNLVYQFFVHTDLVYKLPAWFESIFNSPSHHRVHHASNNRYLDRNHAGVLIIWDKFFGTFSEEKKNEKPVYGLTSNIETYNPFLVATHEYSAIIKDVRRAKSWKDKLKYIFYSPGWSHDGKDLRAKTLRKK